MAVASCAALLRIHAVVCQYDTQCVQHVHTSKASYDAKGARLCCCHTCAPRIPPPTSSHNGEPLPLLFFSSADEFTSDGSRYNPAVMSFIRDEWIYKQMRERYVDRRVAAGSHATCTPCGCDTSCSHAFTLPSASYARREAEYTEFRPLRVFVGTWNVNGKFPKEDITPWLCQGADTDAKVALNLPDVYVVGLQEMVDLTATNVALGGESKQRSKAWISLLEERLNAASPPSSDAAYECVGSRYLVGICIAVFVKARWRRAVTEVQDNVAPVGVLGVMGNKVRASQARYASMCRLVWQHVTANPMASSISISIPRPVQGGASIRLRIFDSTFCFVCAHLAAHRGAVTQRNADYASIMAKTVFSGADDAQGRGDAGGAGTGSGRGGGGGPGAGSSAASAAAAADLMQADGSAADVNMRPDGSLKSVGIADADLVIWLGDFNYRIDESVSPADVFAAAEGRRGVAGLAALRARDQLNIERAKGAAFAGFLEGQLSFPPTYKYQAGTSIYEQRPEKKLRAPAWCDRVLWRVAPGIDVRHVRQLYYGAVEELLSSDHKPVHALFEVAVRRVDRDARVAVIGDITRALDAMENRAMPRLDLSAASVAFSDVVYAVPATRTVTLRNTGEVVATWRFVPKPEERLLCNPWLAATPAYGMLPPGQTATITFTATVDVAVARDISLGREAALWPATGGSTGADGALPLGPAPMTAGGLLEDVLILRVERGRDFFVSVTATVLPTAFGASLAQLAMRPEPMRAIGITTAAAVGGGAATALDPSAGSRALTARLAVDEADAGGAEATSSDASRKGSPIMGVPKEIWRLVDAIVRTGASKSRGLFLALPPGGDAVLLEVREALDTGQPIPPGVDPLALSQTLLDLLSSLREPLIPVALFPGPDMERAGVSVEMWCAHVLRHVAPLNYNVLVYLLRFLREVVLRDGASNGCTAESLGLVFSRAIMRRLPHDDAAAVASSGVEGATPSGAAQLAAASPIAAAAPTGADDDGAAGDGAILAEFADRGTRWEPSATEQDVMTRGVAHFLSPKCRLVPGPAVPMGGGGTA